MKMDYSIARLSTLLTMAIATMMMACSPAEPPGDPVQSGTTDSDEAGIDLIVEGDYIVTMDADGAVLENGAGSGHWGTERAAARKMLEMLIILFSSCVLGCLGPPGPRAHPRRAWRQLRTEGEEVLAQVG